MLRLGVSSDAQRVAVSFLDGCSTAPAPCHQLHGTVQLLINLRRWRVWDRAAKAALYTLNDLLHQRYVYRAG
jgi:hypothetical protein